MLTQPTCILQTYNLFTSSWLLFSNDKTLLHLINKLIIYLVLQSNLHACEGLTITFNSICYVFFK